MQDNKNFLGTEPIGKLASQAVYPDRNRPAYQYAL